ncbi:MAG: GTPase-associated system all-helical protein GASH [Terracidiphilus sp.]|jgi:hypothetical protein
MSESVLLQFLSKGLVDVKGDDTKFAKLEATSAEVATLLKKYPAKATNYAWIAFDPQAPASDPVVLDVLEVLKKQWPTYVNTFAGTPIAVLRAILLDALIQAAYDDDRVAVSFAACARNLLPFMETGNEQEIWLEVVKRIEADVDKRAEQEWATPASITVGPFVHAPIAAIKISNSAVKINGS